MELGSVPVTVGLGLTVKHPVHEPDWVSVLVTVTLRAPVVAVGVIVMLAVTWVVSTKVVEFTVMPVPENDATAPWAKFVPMTETSWPRSEERRVGSEVTA